MLKHLYTLCWNQKGANSWIWAEMLIVSIILWLVVDSMYVNLRPYFLPMGNNTEDVYRIYFQTRNNTETEDPEVLKQDLLTVLDRIRNYPGVEHLSYSMYATPYTWASSSRGYQKDTLHKSSGQTREVSPEFFHVFQCVAEGETSASLVRLFEGTRACIVSPLLAEQIFGTENPIGQKLNINENDSTDYLIVKAVMKHFKRSDYDNPNRFAFCIYNQSTLLEKINLSNIPRIEFCVRVSPRASQGFSERFSKEMSRSLRIGNIYLMNIKSFNSLKRLFNRPKDNNIKQMGSLAIFLLINLFLGIVGTFWIRTQFRKGEIGLRIAMGSTRKELISLLVGEGMVLLAISFIPAMLIELNLGLAELINIESMPFTPGRFLITQSITLVLMAVMIYVGISIPTYQYTKLQPSEALRYE